MPETLTYDQLVDTSHLLCPLPVYQASLALRDLDPGRVLHVVTTDPGSLEDIPALVRQTGDELLAKEDLGASQRFWIRKGGAA